MYRLWAVLAASLLLFQFWECQTSDVELPTGKHGLYEMTKTKCHPKTSKTLYDFHLDGLGTHRPLDWDRYKGSAVMITNVASFSHNADYQYRNLNALWNDVMFFKIIAVPCNQFGMEEPANETEIMTCIREVRPGRNFQPDFTMAEKLDVNGEHEHPIFTFLKEACPPPVKDFQPSHELHYHKVDANDIRWNFEKFLLDRRGRPVYRYSSYYRPLDIAADLHKLLKQH